MPTGIILKSASHEVSDEVREKNLAAVVESAGYEVQEKAEDVLSEPQRNSFRTEDEFEAAHVAWQDKEDEREEKEAEAAAPKPAVTTKKLSRRERAVERATAELKAEVAELRKKLESKEPEKKEPEAPKENPRPKRADFDSDETYEDALLAWGVQKTLADKSLKDAEKASQSRFEQTIQNFASQIEEAKEQHDDWDDLKEKFDKNDVNIGQSTQLAILESENGAEVLYYLMRHPAKAAKLGEMSPLSAVMEVGRLSSRLKTGAAAPAEADDEEPRKSKPKVPAPVRTVGSGTPSGEPSFAEVAARPNYPGKARDLRLAQAAK